MRGNEDLGCIAVAPGWEPDGRPHLPDLPRHLHRCIATQLVHVGLHWCRCGLSFKVNPLTDFIDYFRDQQIIDAMERGLLADARDGESMTSPLDSLVTITFVADANTPAQYLPSVGKVLALAAPIQVGSGGHLQGIPGLVRQGTGGLEFLMTADVPVSTDTTPAWAQQLATALAAINGKLDTIIGGAAREADLQTAIGKLDQIIGGAARQNTLNAIGADVAAIKTKTGA